MDEQLTRVIANGTVAAPYGTFRAHVVIAGERIAAFSDDDGVLAGWSWPGDHCAYTIEEKSLGYDDIFAAPNGCQVMQEMVPVVLDEAFHRRGMTLSAFARLISERPARIAGVYPRKGSMLVGSDADLVLWDLEEPWVIDPGSQQFSKNPWSPFEGRKIRARVARTLVRGQTAYTRGEIQVGAGFGRFLSGRGDYSLAGR